MRAPPGADADPAPDPADDEPTATAFLWSALMAVADNPQTEARLRSWILALLREDDATDMT